MLIYLADLLNFDVWNENLYMRSGCAFLLALVIVLMSGSKFIDFLKMHQKKGQPIRETGPQSHLLTKKGTPTMGGIMILTAAIAAMLLCCKLTDVFVWVGIGVLLIFAGVGFVDDYIKVTKQTSAAMSAKMKLLLQFLTSLAAILIISYVTPVSERFVVNLPYIDFWKINLGWLYVPFAMIVIAGTSNGVNLSDGLDGLAGGLLTITFTVFMIVALIFGGATALEYNVTGVEGIGEVAVMCAAVIGACVGFLKFNLKPAKVFMGDVGSLSLGAFLGLVAVMLKQEFLLVVAGGVFVVESISVMMQVGWFKISKGKRLFRMAPIHHHFEQLGWSEVKVVYSFWGTAFVCALLALLSFVCI